MRVHSQRVTRSRSRVAAAAATALAVAALAGCGGGSDNDVTRDDFIAEADAICAQYAAGSEALEVQFDEALRNSDLESAAQDFEDQASEVTAMLDQLAGLEPPVADQTTMDQIIALGRQRVEVAEKAANAIASGDKDTMIASGKEASVLAGQYFQLADGFGFETCGSGGGAGGSGATGSTGTTGPAS